MRSFILAVCLPIILQPSPSAGERPRLAILTDIGGDPDDQQSMIRLLAYANEFYIEALIASASGTPGELKKAVTRTDLILQIIDASHDVNINRLRFSSKRVEHAVRCS